MSVGKLLIDEKGLNKTIIVTEEVFCNQCFGEIKPHDTAFICQINKELSCRNCEVDIRPRAEKYVCKETKGCFAKKEHIHFRGTVVLEVGK